MARFKIYFENAMKRLHIIYRKPAILLLSVCLIFLGSADIFALCFSGDHSGGVAIHYTMHKEAPATQPASAATGFSEAHSCVDIPIRTLTKNTRISPVFQCPALIGTGTPLDSDMLAFLSRQYPGFEASIPVPSPPVFLQTQTFLN